MILINKNKKTPIEQLQEFHKEYNQEKAQKKEMCHDHNLRKTSFCLECKTYICDKCLPLSFHSTHPTKHLSLMAYQVVESVNKEYVIFEKNLALIQDVRPQEWQSLIRDKLIKFFDSITERLSVIKQYTFRNLNAVLKSMNYPSLQREIIDLESSQPLLKDNYEALKLSFENNHFSQIAQRQKHYRSYIEALEILNIQS